jgi:hypothetical protein
LGVATSAPNYLHCTPKVSLSNASHQRTLGGNTTIVKQIAICIAVNFTLLCGGVWQADATPVISALPFVTANVGDSITIPIAISGVTDLTSFQFDLLFVSGLPTRSTIRNQMCAFRRSKLGREITENHSTL